MQYEQQRIESSGVPRHQRHGLFRAYGQPAESLPIQWRTVWPDGLEDQGSNELLHEKLFNQLFYYKTGKGAPEEPAAFLGTAT